MFLVGVLWAGRYVLTHCQILRAFSGKVTQVDKVFLGDSIECAEVGARGNKAQTRCCA